MCVRVRVCVFVCERDDVVTDVVCSILLCAMECLLYKANKNEFLIKHTHTHTFPREVLELAVLGVATVVQWCETKPWKKKRRNI